MCDHTSSQMWMAIRLDFDSMPNIPTLMMFRTCKALSFTPSHMTEVARIWMIPLLSIIVEIGGDLESSEVNMIKK